MTTFDCPRCDGKGHIPFFNHVRGGVCFQCCGAGKVAQKTPPQKARKFAISGVRREDGQRIAPIFHIGARSEKEAIRKSNARFAASTGYVPGSATIHAPDEAEVTDCTK